MHKRVNRFISNFLFEINVICSVLDDNINWMCDVAMCVEYRCI